MLLVSDAGEGAAHEDPAEVLPDHQREVVPEVPEAHRRQGTRSTLSALDTRSTLRTLGTRSTLRTLVPVVP